MNWRMPNHALVAALVSLALACSNEPEHDTENNADNNSTGNNQSTDTTQNNGTTETTPMETTVETPDFTIEEGCNPVSFDTDCFFPYPSNVFLADDATTPSGKIVELPTIAKPRKQGNRPFDFMDLHPADGFSVHQPIMALFPAGVDTSNVIFHDGDAAASLQASNTTILLDADSGELVAHWAEIDRNSDEPAEQTFIVRSFAPLKHSTRYIVALQSLKDASGADIEAPRGFKEIRDAAAGEHPVLAPLAARYEQDVFPALETAGVTRANLQLAWDFTTGSREFVTRDLLSIRQQIMDTYATEGPAVTITKTEVDPRDQIAYRVEGTIEVPLFLEADEPSAMLNRDDAGNVAPNGTHQVPFVFQIGKGGEPQDESYQPLRLIQYGHGFFGLKEEINYGAMRRFSDGGGWAMIAVDWVGMSEEDLMVVINRIPGDTGRLFEFIDRLHQSMANQLALTYAVKSTMLEVPELELLGKTVYDPDQVYYYGISQGGIFGGVVMALSPHFERAVFGVGGGPYSLMMSRATNFALFLSLLEVALENDHTAIQKVVTLSQHTFDRVSPIVFAPFILNEKLDGNPDKRVLLQVGMADLQVNNLASDVHARAIGVPVITPSSRTPYGLDEVTAAPDSHTRARASSITTLAYRPRTGTSTRPRRVKLRTRRTIRCVSRWSPTSKSTASSSR